MKSIRKNGAIAAVGAAVGALIMTATTAFGASTSVNMAAGDSATVTCAGPSLSFTQNGATGGNLSCAQNPTTTTTPSSDTGVLLGDQSVASNADTSTGTASEAFEFTASQSGTATSISAYITSTDGAHLALYDDNGGKPGNLLDQGTVATNTAGWVTIPLNAGVQVTAGTRYWIALGSNGGKITYRDAGSSGSNLDFSGTGFASPYASNGQWSSNPVSAYVSGTVSSGGGTTTTTAPPQTTTTVPQTTTTVPSGGGGTGGGGTCTNPVYSTSDPQGTYNVDPGGPEYWWVNNDAWSGSHGPQTINVCSEQSWYAVSNQPNNGGSVETYPDTEYDVGGRNAGTTKPISQYQSITSTFAEQYPATGSWDAAYDLWMSNWTKEVMIWNEDRGSVTYWNTQGTPVTIGGVNYHWINYGVGNEQILIRDSQEKSGSVDILGVLKFLVSQGILSPTDVPAHLEYGVEIEDTGGQTLTFPTTGVTFSLS